MARAATSRWLTIQEQPAAALWRLAFLVKLAIGLTESVMRIDRFVL